MWVISGKARVEHLLSALTPIADERADILDGQPRANSDA